MFILYRKNKRVQSLDEFPARQLALVRAAIIVLGRLMPTAVGNVSSPRQRLRKDGSVLVVTVLVTVMVTVMVTVLVTVLGQCRDSAGTVLPQCWPSAGTMLGQCWDSAGG